jgi:lysophospholipase L1-like esterase
VRDSEAALRQPRSIVIGDSHAMGWGVEAEERYSHLLSPKLQPSLNLGISSYGTARELRLLERYAGLYPQGYASARTILLQYGVNDWGENSSTGKQRFQSSSYRSYAANTPYVKPELLLDPWNAAHLRLFTEHWLKGILKAEANPLDVPFPKHGEAFVASFMPYKQLLAGKSLVVFVSSDCGLWNASVYRDLEHSLGSLRRQLPHTRVLLLNLSQACDSSCYFQLDDHLTAAGHQRLAQWLNQSLTALIKPAPATH